MNKQSRDNDIEVCFRLKDADGNTLDPSLGKVAFELRVRNDILAAHTGSEPFNCYVRGDQVVVCVAAEAFDVGVMDVRVCTIVPDDHFPGNTRKVWSKWIETELMFV